MTQKENATITKEDIILDYRAVQKSLGKEKINRTEYLARGNYPRYHIDKLFGGWNNLKKELGEKILMHKHVTKDMISENARELYDKHQKLTAEIMRKEGFSQIVVDKHFGNFSNMMYELGLKQESIGLTRSLSDEKFLSSLLTIQEKHGYVNAELLAKHSSIPLASFINRYGTFGEACLKAGVRHIGKDTIAYYEGEAVTTIRQIAELLNDQNYHTELTFDWLRNDATGFPLPVDAYFPDKKLVVEYNGIYHYSRDYYLNKKYNSIDETKRRDELREKLCKQNGFKMITVPYFDKDNLHKYFQEFL